jgi:hypothetical protein
MANTRPYAQPQPTGKGLGFMRKGHTAPGYTMVEY